MVYARIELKNFYPYGPANGDAKLNKTDDGTSGRINIASSFPFFDDEHDFLFVSSFTID